MLNLRDHYVIPADSVELRAFTHGSMPKTVPAMMAAFADDWKTHGVDAWNNVPNHWKPDSDDQVGWWTLPEYLGDAFIAPLLGAPVGTCIHQPNAHWIVSALLSCEKPFRDNRDEIVCSSIDFPSVLHTVQRWSALRNASPVIVASVDGGFLDAQAILDAISEKTALVIVSHVGFSSGERVTDDILIAIREKAHRNGALFVIDGYHAAGTMPIDVIHLGCDVYLGGLLKDASGSSGNAYVYIRPGLDLTPALTGWFGNHEPFAFHHTPSPSPSVRRRFMGGTPAIASMYHAVEGVRILLEAGIENVHRHVLELSDYAIERFDAAGLPLRSPREHSRRSVMLVLDIPHADNLCEFLKTRDVYTDSRKGQFLRLAPFVWNTQNDVERACDKIIQAVSEGHYQTFTRTHDGGPVT